ncbi:MarR family winged helix-turn-helix transcriptional regulator [Paenibacillus spongiae]|uniref:MarR family transcriptional regulator n=1 Tax=Paenibacillus spongiae TaxID=2909671 RepID=A0ABY5S419_9BACL|nr:MarR family transcriptional regulator [Paenibacillus spongiae]UVI28223.1 MarR family transcriptional regulator [Paenibacillus spongiae]
MTEHYAEDNEELMNIAYSERFQRAFSLINRKLNGVITQQLEEGLTGPQCYILKLIMEKGHATTSQLAERMEVKPSAITVMIERLVQNGFVERNPDANDRRVIQLQLTESGKHAIFKVRQQYHSILSRLFHESDIEDREAFIGSFERIAQAASKLND